jgi:hypothetical protein
MMSKYEHGRSPDVYVEEMIKNYSNSGLLFVEY